VVRAAIVLAALLSVTACKKRPPACWIGMDRAAAACSWDPDRWARQQTCIAGGRRYTCIQGDDGSTWQCAPIVVDVAAEARP